MVLPFCTALDPDILKGGGMTCACLLTVLRCIQTKTRNVSETSIPKKNEPHTFYESLILFIEK